MMTPEQTENHLKQGWSEETLLEVDEFLSSGLFHFHNLANIGGGDYRLMYKEITGKDAKGNPTTKMQCRLGRIHYVR